MIIHEENHIKNSTADSIPWLSIFNLCYDNPQHLGSTLIRYGISAAELLKISEKPIHPSEPYGRKILFKDSKIEVMLAQWSYQAMAHPHNHGHSQGLIWFAFGDFFEQHFLFRDQNLIPQGEPLFYKEGAVAKVIENDIHSCCPVTEGLSLHLYTPPIDQMKVWDSINKKTLTLANQCGAWIPENNHLILNSTSW